MATRRAWLSEAIRRIEADFNRSADTHLIPLKLPGYPDIDIYLKDESSHPTGSLKHRLARSLFLYALVNGWLEEGKPVIEASSGSTAVSEAYFAHLLVLPFIAVMPDSTSPEKIAAIRFNGGESHLVPATASLHDESVKLAGTTGGHFLDQFTYAERATDWRANNNIAESIFNQMRLERHPIPRWIVMSCGTGGTSATLGRYVRHKRHETGVLCVDPENSAFYPYFSSCINNNVYHTDIKYLPPRIEGIGRPTPEASFIPACVDAMLRVPDALSLAAMRYVSAKLCRRVGGSTGTNFVGILRAAEQMKRKGQVGSLVTILCDGGERYTHSYYNPDWYANQGIDITEADRLISACANGTESLSLEQSGSFS
ncbi:MAG: PLP-dependent cysteine synthase family protein [Pseudomonadota bacterium]